LLGVSSTILFPGQENVSANNRANEVEATILPLMILAAETVAFSLAVLQVSVPSLSFKVVTSRQLEAIILVKGK
jgi:hypothetical protein